MMTPVNAQLRGSWRNARAKGTPARTAMPPPPWLECIDLAARAGLRLRVGDVAQATRLVQDAMHLGAPAVHAWAARWRVRRVSSRILKDLRAAAGGGHRPSWADAAPLLQPVRHTAVQKAQTAIRLYALGGFSLSLRGIPFLGGAKPSRRPLELLKALIASGEGMISAAGLADSLWPDADGDDARNSLQVAVYRLRRLLHCDAAVVVHDGRISLDRDLCWVDAWEFERQATRLLQAPAEPPRSLDQARAALELYRGHLFAQESEAAWMLSYRERLRMSWSRLVRRTGALHEAAGRWEQASELYQRALELDPLLEDLYRRLMQCQQRTGERCAALYTYERCRQQLVRVLGVSPSVETERLYRTLRAVA